jgi:hypothetical protein
MHVLLVHVEDLRHGPGGMGNGLSGIVDDQLIALP